MNRNSKLFSAMPATVQEFAFRLHHWKYFFWKRAAAGHYKRLNVGAGTKIDRDSLILGWKNIRIGKNVMISEGVVINVNNWGDNIRVEIRDNSAINRDCFIVNADLVQLGEYTLFGPGCRLLGGNHVFSTPFIPYIASGNTDTGKIIVGANCWFGAGVSVIGSVKIGHGCVIGANSMVLKDVPPFSLVIGSPAHVVKRFDISRNEWVPAEEFTEEQESLIPEENEYLAGLKRDYPSIAMPFAASGRSRGDLA